MLIHLGRGKEVIHHRLFLGDQCDIFLLPLSCLIQYLPKLDGCQYSRQSLHPGHWPRAISWWWMQQYQHSSASDYRIFRAGMYLCFVPCTIRRRQRGSCLLPGMAEEQSVSSSWGLYPDRRSWRGGKYCRQPMTSSLWNGNEGLKAIHQPPMWWSPMLVQEEHITNRALRCEWNRHTAVLLFFSPKVTSRLPLLQWRWSKRSWQ